MTFKSRWIFSGFFLATKSLPQLAEALCQLMTADTLITLASAIFSGFAVIVALRSWAVSREALELTKIEHEERHEEVMPYLIDCISWESQQTGYWVIFALSLINRANAPNSLIRIDLKIHGYDAAGNTSSMIIEPTTKNIEEIIPWQLQPLTSPLNMQPRETLSGWLSFNLPSVFRKQKAIDKYELIGTTAAGARISVESYLLRKVVDERTKS